MTGKAAGGRISEEFVIEAVTDVLGVWGELLPLFEGQAEYHAPLLGMQPSENWRELLLKRFRQTENVVFMAKAGDKPIGFLSASMEIEDRLWPFDYLDIDNVFVVEEWRGRGVGRALLRHAEAWALDNHIPELQLTVLSNNDRAVAVWSRSGFRPMSHRMSKRLEVAE